MKRVANILMKSEGRPEQILAVQWGGLDKDHEPELPHGFDVLDQLIEEGSALEDRLVGLGRLIGRIHWIPSFWLEGRTEAARSSGGTQAELLPCDRYEDLIVAWSKAMRWTEGLDRGLSVMLSCIVSVRSIGDQLWVKIIGPASCGKSTLCEAISTNEQYVLAKSTIRGFHSGSTDQNEDNSLLCQLADKTLVTKDGDTLLQQPNLGQILAEARDVYDTTSRASYRIRRASRDYVGLRMTWILCGTASLRKLDSSELGERFLDCVLMDGIDEELEDEVLYRVADRTARNMAIEAGDASTGQTDPDLCKAMQLTGGYINYLRANCNELFSSLEIPPNMMAQCVRLGKYVAYLRARPSTSQDEKAEREFAARLVSQFVRLASCLCVVMNKKVMDEEVLRRVRRTAMDTARGITLNIATELFKRRNPKEGQKEGAEVRTLMAITDLTEQKTRQFLIFLKQIGVCEVFTPTLNGVRGTPRWRLTKQFGRLFQLVSDDAIPF